MNNLLYLYNIPLEEAADAANFIKPVVAVPVHYSAIGNTDGFQLSNFYLLVE